MKIKHMITRSGRLSLLAGVLIALGSTAAVAEPVKIRISWSVAPAHLTPLITMVPKKIYRHWGKSYIVEPIRMRGSGPMATALAAKEVDIAGYSYQAFSLSVVNANLQVRAIADVLTNKPPHANAGFWVRKADGINKVEDLKGKRLAVNARGSGVDASLRKMLMDHKLTDGRDYQIVEIRFPNMLSALDSKRVDMSFLVLPFNFIAERKGKFKRLFTLRDSLGPNVTVLWTTRKEFIDKNRAALVDFIEDQIRMRRWLYDPKNREAAVQLVAKATKRPAKNYAGWVFTKKDNFRSLDAKFDAAMLQRNVDDLYKLKVTKGTFDTSKYIDLSIAEEANKRIK